MEEVSIYGGKMVSSFTVGRRASAAAAHMQQMEIVRIEK
jgi:hypothetical protein